MSSAPWSGRRHVPTYGNCGGSGQRNVQQPLGLPATRQDVEPPKPWPPSRKDGEPPAWLRPTCGDGREPQEPRAAGFRGCGPHVGGRKRAATGSGQSGGRQQSGGRGGKKGASCVGGKKESKLRDKMARKSEGITGEQRPRVCPYR